MELSRSWMPLMRSEIAWLTSTSGPPARAIAGAEQRCRCRRTATEEYDQLTNHHPYWDPAFPSEDATLRRAVESGHGTRLVPAPRIQRSNSISTNSSRTVDQGEIADCAVPVAAVVEGEVVARSAQPANFRSLRTTTSRDAPMRATRRLRSTSWRPYVVRSLRLVDDSGPWFVDVNAGGCSRPRWQRQQQGNRCREASSRPPSAAGPSRRCSGIRSTSSLRPEVDPLIGPLQLDFSSRRRRSRQRTRSARSASSRRRCKGLDPRDCCAAGAGVCHPLLRCRQSSGRYRIDHRCRTADDGHTASPQPSCFKVIAGASSSGHPPVEASTPRGCRWCRLLAIRSIRVPSTTRRAAVCS
ncbi:MAG: hypothetical protein CM15mP77_1350 [Synechococcus sp.]|nr:MAG: hypothetical protein CM15mP77_1350 [Synechococcus sp.]